MSHDITTALKELADFGPEAIMSAAVLNAISELPSYRGDDPGPGVGALAKIHETMTPEHTQLLDRTLRDWVIRCVEVAWKDGWMPRDLERAIRKRATAIAASVLVDCMAFQLARSTPEAMHAQLHQQLASLGPDPSAANALHFVQRRAQIEGTDAVSVIRALVRLLAVFPNLPRSAMR